MSSRRVSISAISLSFVVLMLNSVNAADLEAGRIKSTQCAICHGDEGKGNGAPKSCIAGMDEEVFIKHLQDFKSGARKNVWMERFARKLSDEDIENLAAYYATK